MKDKKILNLEIIVITLVNKEVHGICNLGYRIPNGAPVVIHNKSNYGNHFAHQRISTELDFVSNDFERFGENKKGTNFLTKMTISNIRYFFHELCSEKVYNKYMKTYYHEKTCYYHEVQNKTYLEYNNVQIKPS